MLHHWNRCATALTVALCILVGSAHAAERQPSADTALLQEPLDPDALAEAVLARNPGLEAMRAAVAEAAARIEPAGSLDDPMLSFAVAPNTFDSQLGGRGQVQISQALPWWGTLDAREAAARAGADAATEDLESLALRLRAAAQSAFADWRYIHRAIAVNEHHQALFAELREVAKAHYAAGRAPQQDVLQADVERTVLRQQALELAQQRTAIQARINALLNRPASTPVPLPGPLPAATDLPPLTVLESFALEQHPSVRQLQFDQSAASARVTLAEKARLPEFRLTAGYNSLWENQDLRSMVGVSINIPLDQGKRSAEVNGARARVRRTEQALADRRAQLSSELAAAYAAVDEARRSLALYRDELVPLADATLGVAQSDYAGGEGDFLYVITAERRRLTTELGLARTAAQLFKRLAELGRLAGTSYPIDIARTARVADAGSTPHD